MQHRQTTQLIDDREEASASLASRLSRNRRGILLAVSLTLSAVAVLLVGLLG